jgi:hypothetical protein
MTDFMHIATGVSFMVCLKHKKFSWQHSLTFSNLDFFALGGLPKSLSFFVLASPNNTFVERGFGAIALPSVRNFFTHPQHPEVCPTSEPLGTQKPVISVPDANWTETTLIIFAIVLSSDVATLLFHSVCVSGLRL